MIASPPRVWNSSDPDIRDEVLRRAAAGEPFREIGRDFLSDTGGAVPKDTVRAVVRRARRLGHVETGPVASAAPSAPPARVGGVQARGLADGSMLLDSGKGTRIKTLDDLLRVGEVDLARWEVDSWTLNKWDSVMRGQDRAPLVSELVQVKARLRPIPGVGMAAELIAGLIADLAERAPTPSPMKYAEIPAGNDRHMLVVSMADHHIGLLAWGEETTHGDYDSEIAERLASEAMADLLRKASVYACERVLVLIGGDWYHTDRALEGKGGTTTAGTPQDVDTRYQKMWRAGQRAAIAIVDAARQFAPVTVQITVGNHDTDRLMALGDVLGAWYRNDDAVEIRNAPAPRHYYRYGANLLGFCHGHQAKGSDLPLLMASEAPNEWAATTFREWLTGHYHAKQVVSDDKAGVQVHVTPSLCPPDSWHAGRGLLHRRSCEARIYHVSDGPIATLTFNARRAA